MKTEAPLFAPVLLFAAFLLTTACGPRWTEIETEHGYNLIVQKKGSQLGYAPSSGTGILVVDRYAFKDMNRNGMLDPYEDWRLSAVERAEDLASRLSIDEIAGLMLYSSHERSYWRKSECLLQEI